MTLVLDSGGLSGLVGDQARLAELRRRGLWPAQVPAAVLVETLTGDARRDCQVNRLLRACQVRGVGETLAREAALLRASTGRAGTVSAVDAIVVAHAASCPDPVVLTSDPADLTALAANAPTRITIARA